ncbi:MAG: ribose-phosphate pyrophosphokinase [Candidatus Eisenbacteria bacterium]|nr:ribose-phosphate pyrophosphokinase [Candidatus Eisenbacteria bacterium]
MKIFSGNANKDLAQEVCLELGISLGDADVSCFSDGETTVKINENIRGVDVFVFQSTNSPASNLMELLVMLDAAKRASARRVTAVIPYFGYARQDRKDQPRVSITAKLVANVIATAGADRVLTMDLHAPQIQGFFDIPFDHIYAAPVLIDYFKNKGVQDLVVLAPDIGSVKMARGFAKRLGASLAIVDKRRPAPNEAEIMHLIGDVKDKRVVIIDDIVDTAGTLTQAARVIADNGAMEVFAGCTHAVLSNDAIKKIRDCPIKELVTTNTIHHDASGLDKKMKTLSVAKLLAEAVKRIHEERSLSSLFV